MKRNVLATVLMATVAAAAGADQNKERLLIDDMEDVSDWTNGSPQETTLSAAADHVKEGRFSLKFANLVDQTTGEKNYPVGWPRTRKSLAAMKRTDWTDYDFFECWIYVATSRDSLPGTPIGLGFYHSGSKRSSAFVLKEVKKDDWVKIVIPVSEIERPDDVQAVQFHISEANYRHGDRVDFYVDDMVLTRFIHPVIDRFDVDRKLLYTTDRRITAAYTLMGRQGMSGATLQLAVGPADGPPAATAAGPASRQGELPVAIAKPLPIGKHRATLTLLDREGSRIDHREVDFRVIDGPL